MTLASPGAVANGRYPAAQQLLVDPSDAGRYWLRTTYGLLTSPDSGRSWSWICESGVGYDPTEDPSMAITGQGGVLAGASEGLFSSRDHGCLWSRSSDLGTRSIQDLATEGDANHVVVLTERFGSSASPELAVWRSQDGGATYRPVAEPLSEGVSGHTIDVAPSDPQRLYVSGAEWPVTATLPGDGGGLQEGGVDGGSSVEAPGVLFRSRDGGSTWQRLAIPGSSFSAKPFIAAVHPGNPDVLYVRVQGPSVTQGYVQSWLLYSADGGESWKEVFRGPADMMGFALGHDGSAVFVGLGDSHDPTFQRPVDRTAVGIYRATAPGLSFSRVFSGQVGCLSSVGTELFVCGSHATEHFELGVSKDDGASVSTVLDYSNLGGPLECPADSPQALFCVPSWPYICSGFQGCPATTSTGATVAAGARGGCDCGGHGTSSRSGSGTSTTRLDMTSEPSALASISVMLLAYLLRRGPRQRR